MHKATLRNVFVCLIIITGILCFVKVVELGDLENQKNELIKLKSSIDDFAKKIGKSSFSCLKSKEKIFDRGDDQKKFIEQIARKLNVKKVSVKRNSTNEIEEIKILTDQEKKIYAFIDGLIFESSGMVQINSVRLFPADRNNLTGIIKFKTHLFDKNPNLISINPSRRNYSISSINLFGKVKLHKLLATVHNAKAYVNDSWFEIGDKIDDYRLVHVDQNFIEIQEDDGLKIQVKLGGQW
ncbi:MAG: hypothetical protein LBF54_00795 [Holosporaceae bacterium]|jgi:hypothetical protein|nr:hypothetical protein [Holosporaceae bacterium]